MAFTVGDVVRVTKDCDGYGYPTFVGEVGYVTGISSVHSDGGTVEDPVIFVEFNKRILDGEDYRRMTLFTEELEYVGRISNWNAVFGW